MTEADTLVPADAVPPVVPGAEARFRRFRFGDLEAFVLSDGGSPIASPPGTDPPAVPRLRALACLLLRMPGTDRLVLMDAGWGPSARRFGKPLPTAGRLLGSLGLAGIDAADIDAVLVSHIHPDHVDGLFDDAGRKVFPNASYHAAAEEVAFWSRDDLDLSGSPAPAPLKEQMIGSARRMLGFAGSTLQTFRTGEDALPGIATIGLPGHTPAQVGFMMSFGGGRLLYTADAMTTPEMSVDTPERLNTYDHDPEQGVATRRALLEMLSKPGWHSFTPHFPFPALGQMRTEAGRFAWQPASDAQMDGTPAMPYPSSSGVE